MAVGYLLLATLATGLAVGLRGDLPWTYATPWLSLQPVVAQITSVATGVALACAVVLGTRVAVARFAWARRFHHDLRPVARDLTLGHVLLLAGLSSLGEELLFRGLLVPWIGVLASAVVFGLAHQIRGPSRWVWIAWATVVGVGFGTIFAATGSLLGPLVAHATINAVNLAFLRDYDPGPIDHGPIDPQQTAGA